MNITQYTVQEDATPRDPSQFSGGYGQLSYSRLEKPPEVYEAPLGVIMVGSDGKPYISW